MYGRRKTQMQFLLDKIIYLYLFISLALLVFNILYILRGERIEKHKKKRYISWQKEFRALAFSETDREVSQKHLGRMKKRLKKTEELEAWHRALFDSKSGVLQNGDTKWFEWYFEQTRPVFLELALEYQKTSAMERAFFAYVAAAYYSYRGDGGGVHDQMAEVLLTYLKDSTVYVREQVLQALYVIGDADALEQTFSYMCAQGMHHQEKLIADGLLHFRGDKEQLVKQLWNRRGDWAEWLQIGIVQFAGNVSGAFCRLFFESLTEKDTLTEVRYALMRYFRHWPYSPAGEYLKKKVSETDEEEFLIVAVFVLDAYPGDDTRRILKGALCHRNWYVRRNAAVSLKNLGITGTEQEEILSGSDCYAAEMLTYILGGGK